MTHMMLMLLQVGDRTGEQERDGEKERFKGLSFSAERKNGILMETVVWSLLVSKERLIIPVTS